MNTDQPIGYDEDGPMYAVSDAKSASLMAIAIAILAGVIAAAGSILST